MGWIVRVMILIRGVREGVEEAMGCWVWVGFLMKWAEYVLWSMGVMVSRTWNNGWDGRYGDVRAVSGLSYGRLNGHGIRVTSFEESTHN